MYTTIIQPPTHFVVGDCIDLYGVCYCWEGGYSYIFVMGGGYSYCCILGGVYVVVWGGGGELVERTNQGY